MKLSCARQIIYYTQVTMKRRTDEINLEFKIVSYLPVQYQFQCKRVCQRWNREIAIEAGWPRRSEEFSGRTFPWLQFMLLRFPEKTWNWEHLSRNPSITPEFVQTNTRMPWEWSQLSANPSITWEFIQTNPDKPWSWRNLSGFV